MNTLTIKDIILKLEDIYHLIRALKIPEAQKELNTLEKKVDENELDPEISSIFDQLRTATNPATIINDPRYLEDVGSHLNTLLYKHVKPTN